MRSRDLVTNHRIDPTSSLARRARLVYLDVADTSTPPRVWPQRSEPWIGNIYSKIQSWNSGGNQVVRCVCLFRFEDSVLNGLQFGIGSSTQAMQDLKTAAANKVTWK